MYRAESEQNCSVPEEPTSNLGADWQAGVRVLAGASDLPSFGPLPSKTLPRAISGALGGTGRGWQGAWRASQEVPVV